MKVGSSERELRDEIFSLRAELRQIKADLRQFEGAAPTRSILDALPDSVKIYDEDSQLVYINPRGLELHQARDIEALRRPGFTTVVPEAFDNFMDVHRQVLGGETVVGTSEILGLQGRRVQVESRAVPFRLPDGRRGYMCLSRDVTARLQAEQVLHRTQERLRLVHEATDFADFEAEVDGISPLSERFAAQVGLPPETTSLTHQQWLDVVHPGDREHFLTEIDDSFGSDTPHNFEFRIVRADTGEIRWLASSTKIERNQAGEAVRSIGAHLDITERKMAEEELRANGERLRLVHEATGLADFESAPGGASVCSDRYFELCGLPIPADRLMTFEEWLAIVHPDDRERREAEVRTAMVDQDTFSHQFRIIRADNGETRWISSHIRVERDRNGRVLRSIGALLDISEHKRAEDALRASEERLRLVQDATGLADFESDANGLCTCSDRFFEQLGLRVGDQAVAGKGWADLVHPEDRSRLSEEIEAAIAVPQQKSLNTEFRIIRADTGETRWICCNTKLERDENGALIRSIGGHLDITERKESETALRLSEERLRLVQEATGLADFEARPGVICQISDRFIEQVGLPPDTTSLTADEWTAIVHPADRQRFVRHISQNTEADKTLFEYRIVRPDNGEIKWISSHRKMKRDASGKAIASIGAHLDITERKQAEEALRESEERFRLAAEAAGLGVWDYDAVLGKREWSGRFREIVGLPADAEPDLALAEACIHPADRDRVMGQIQAVLRGELNPYETTLRICRANDRAERWLNMNVWRTHKDNNELRRIIMTVRDVTQEKTAEERIRWSATHDGLTRLANRAQFQECLDQAVAEARQDGLAVGILMLDLDHFKQLNDSLGHDVGDALLKMIADRLRHVVGARGTVARLGGDEFAIVVPALESEMDLIQLARTIHVRMSEPFLHQGRILDCRLSSGGAIFPIDCSDTDELLKNADIALYAAKAIGRATMMMFDPQMRDEMRSRRAMVHDAVAAIHDDRILPFYQPKIDLGGRAVVGFEALLRWRLPDGQIGLPADLEAAFEDLEVAAAISDRMIERVVADIRRWLDRGTNFHHVAINASAAEFRRDDFAEGLLEQLRRAEIPTECLQLEVTETVFLGRGAEYVHRALALLHAQGVQIALDDFGTGYASLRHLKQFPVDFIKIDQSFVRDMETDPNDEAIVRAVINLGTSLKIGVVAEGIETASQAAKLMALGCDFGQGFLFAPAVAPCRVPGLIRRFSEEQNNGRRASHDRRLRLA